MAKVIGYVRVSTKGQADDGVSLDMQRAKIAAYAALNDLELGDIFSDEGVSGTVTERPGLNAALAAAKKGDVICVYSISRLSRSTKQILTISEQLEIKGIDLASISEKIDTTTAAGKMVFRMMAILAEFERDQTSERTSAALKQKQSKGEKVGGRIPYGFDVVIVNDVKLLVANEIEQKVIAQVKELRAAGLSLRAIASVLASNGIGARNGKVFAANQIKRMVAA